jgi:O-antigen ligase
MTILLSLFAALFIVGMVLNREALSQTAEIRMSLDKINPIALAYVASSLMLFYMLAFARSKRAMIEALLVVPVLLLIVSLTRSRGMMISTAITLAVYVLALKGTRRIWVMTGLGGVAAVIGYYANPEYVGYVAEALNRIDVVEDQSTAGRVLALHGAWDQFWADPAFGRYAIELQTQFYPHNIYLESLMAVGLLGTVPFAVHCAMAARAAIGLIREKAASFTRVFIALLFIRDAIGAAASGSLWGATAFWITSFLVIAMWYGRQRDQRVRLAQWRRQSMLIGRQ